MLSVERSIPARMNQYYVYVMANIPRTLYVGVTNDLERRVSEHRQATFPSFTGRYRLHRLVYFEATEDVIAAIAREKQIKGWLRHNKVALIEEMNPAWRDLAEDWRSTPVAPGDASLDAQHDSVE